MAETGATQADIARAVGIARPSVNAWLSGKTKHLEGAHLLRAAEFFGVDPEWLATGMGEMRRGAARHHVSKPTQWHDDKTVTVIPHMDVQAKGGDGGLAPADERVIGSIVVMNDWLRRQIPHITSRKNLVVIEAYGRSMEPTLKSGDLLIVDTGVREAKIDGIYILWRLNTPEPEIMVKRIQRMLDGSLMVRSDNRTEYDPEIVPAAQVPKMIKVLGRVVWIWAGREA